MGVINTTLVLNDGVSNPLKRITDTFDRLNSRFHKTQELIHKSIDTKPMQRMEEATNKASKRQEEYNVRLQKGASAANNLVSKVTSLASAYVGFKTIELAVKTSDDFSNTTARLANMNAKFTESGKLAMGTAETTRAIYNAANASRGSFSDMASVIAKLGTNAGTAFSGTAETVKFAELLQKQMKISGTSATEASNALVQLSQALGSGVLRGDELNSIFEQAPGIIQNIADYMDVNISQIRELAGEGRITADIVKNAMFEAETRIEEQFNNMPRTWSDIANQIKNDALMIFKPMADKLNELANSESVKRLANAIGGVFSALVEYVTPIIDMVASAAEYIANNWERVVSVVSTVVTIMGALIAGITAFNAVQAVANTLLAMNPVFLIAAGLTLVIGLVALVVDRINQVTGQSISAAGVVAGAIASLGAIIYNIVAVVYNNIVNTVVTIENLFSEFATFFGNLFINPVATIKATLLELLNYATGIALSAAQVLDKVFGSNLSSAVTSFQAQVQGEINTTIDTAGLNRAELKNPLDYELGYKSIGDVYSGVYDKVSGFENRLKNSISFELSPAGASGGGGFLGSTMTEIANNTGATAGSAGDIADSLAIASEELKYLRDVAEHEVINRFTTAEIKIDMTNNNNVSSSMDIDGIVARLYEGVSEAVSSIAEGAY